MSASSPRRGLWVTLGVLSIIGGLVAAGVLWGTANQRRASAIENLARAPIGCDTTLDFVEPGEYLLFVETTGHLDGVRGDCQAEEVYDLAGAAPDVEITLVDPDGVELALRGAPVDVDYDAEGFLGSARFSVEVTETDDHVLRAESTTAGAFVVAVGRDPASGVGALRGVAVSIGLLGVGLGVALLAFARRRSAPAAAPGPWVPAAVPPQGGFVPGGAPQGPPAYGQPTGPPQYAQQPYPQPAWPSHPQPGAPAPHSQPSPFGQPGAPGGWVASQPPPAASPASPASRQPGHLPPPQQRSAEIPGQPRLAGAPEVSTRRLPADGRAPHAPNSDEGWSNPGESSPQPSPAEASPPYRGDDDLGSGRSDLPDR